MENKSKKLDQIVKISLIIGVLIIALSIGYYLVIFLPQKEVARVEQQKKTQQAKEKEEYQKRIDSCLDNSTAIRNRIDKSNSELYKMGAFVSMKDVFFDKLDEQCVYVLEATFSGALADRSSYLIKDAMTDRIVIRFFIDTQIEEYERYIKEHKDSFDFKTFGE